MPELPEVENIVLSLNKILPGKQFATVKVLHPKSFLGNIDQLISSPVAKVSRRAKMIEIHLLSKLVLLTHLKMTGQLIFVDQAQRAGGGHPSADWVNDLPSKHTRVEFEFIDGSKLYFNDQRIFGWVRLFNQAGLDKQYQHLGLDVNNPQLKVGDLFTSLQRRRIPIKQAIMDNKVMTGLGNIYACDALNLAKISPFRPANSLTKKEVTKLLKSAREVIELGIKLGGSTFDGKYVGVDGLAGGYQTVSRVYDKKGEKCQNCGSLIGKEKLGGRGTYFCGSCQI